MLTVYVIIDRHTGAIAHPKAYTAAGPAKLALRYHYEDDREHYAIAVIYARPTSIITLNDEDKWTEV